MGSEITPNPALLRPPTHVAINLLLALIPMICAFIIARGIKNDLQTRQKVRFLVWSPLLALWLVFLPNTCYLLTEWRHFLETIVTTPIYVSIQVDRSAVLTLLMVTAFYVLYTGAGLWTFFLAIWPLDRLTRQGLGKLSPFLLACLFLLCSLGVYLGLIWRFNSSDLLHPGRAIIILQATSVTLKHPILDIVIVAFAGFLWLLYFLFDIWMDGALARIRQRQVRTIS